MSTSNSPPHRLINNHVRAVDDGRFPQSACAVSALFHTARVPSHLYRRWALLEIDNSAYDAVYTNKRGRCKLPGNVRLICHKAGKPNTICPFKLAIHFPFTKLKTSSCLIKAAAIVLVVPSCMKGVASLYINDLTKWRYYSWFPQMKIDIS
jgi:hypothetical protein